MMDKDFENFGEFKLACSNELPPMELEYIDKKSVEYDRYLFDDFYIMIKKHYDFEDSGFYQVIYEDAYGDWNGMLKTKEEIMNKYNLAVE
jgi:hypothetical protein